MDSVTNAISIRGPLEAVFDLVTSARFWRHWHPATQSVGGVVERPYHRGDLIHEQGQIAGVQFSVTWRVVEHVRPARVVIESEHPSAKILYTFVQRGSDVSFTREVQYEPAVFQSLGRPDEDIGRFMHDQSEHALGQLKALVEDILAAEARPT